MGMPKRSSKNPGSKRSALPEDVSQRAAMVVSIATGELVPDKNPAAVALGRLGGLKGGKIRAERLTPERRAQIASEAARKRWEKKNETD